MKPLRLWALVPGLAAVYGLAWIAHRPDCWHDLADAAVCILLIIAAVVVITCPWDHPWEEK